jgi:sialic acid synthase SpsE
MVYIIAEIGINHNGSIDTAKQLIDVAVVAGVDAVKFQLFYPEEVPNVWEQIKHSDLLCAELVELKEYAELQGIDWLCSAFGPKSIRRLADMGLKILKIPSGRAVDLEYLDAAGECFNNFILSTGMLTNEDIGFALMVLKQSTELKNIALLHCVSEYPTPLEHCDLQRITELKRFAGKVGLSDHSTSNLPSIMAVGMGAGIIEKHITLDTNMDGPDHCCSITPMGLITLVSDIRDAERIL